MGKLGGNPIKFYKDFAAHHLPLLPHCSQLSFTSGSEVVLEGGDAPSKKSKDPFRFLSDLVGG